MNNPSNHFNSVLTSLIADNFVTISNYPLVIQDPRDGRLAGAYPEAAR